MIQFACDSCRRIKALKEVWLMGLAAETVGLIAARREVTILPVWDSEQAVHRLAVHFCSETCKDKYVAKLFGRENAQPEGGKRSLRNPISRAKVSRGKKNGRRGKKAA
ncbi:MAG TPA: hypothetical protein VK555_12040 [Terriglobales bacterium]|nr:hypothetical protein [Terriglobales bacterium]